MRKWLNHMDSSQKKTNGSQAHGKVPNAIKEVRIQTHKEISTYNHTHTRMAKINMMNIQ